MREGSHSLLPTIGGAVILFTIIFILFWWLHAQPVQSPASPTPSDRKPSSIRPLEYEENQQQQSDHFRPREYIRIKDRTDSAQ